MKPETWLYAATLQLLEHYAERFFRWRAIIPRIPEAIRPSRLEVGSGTAVALTVTPVCAKLVLVVQFIPPSIDRPPFRKVNPEPFRAEGELNVSE